MSRSSLLISLVFFFYFSEAQEQPPAQPAAQAPRANPNSACKLGAPAVNPSSLVALTLYSNNGTGTTMDHYLSTLPPTDPSLAGYLPQQVLGKVVMDAAACDCPVRLVQMVDNSTGPFGNHMDHKFIRDGDEPDRFGESYQETDEVVYCVQRKGGCGATIPLYKDFNAINYDSMYATNETLTPWTERYPARPLCYIWAADPNAAVPTGGMPGGAVAGQPAMPGQPQPGMPLATGQPPSQPGQPGQPGLITQPGQTPPGQFPQGKQ